MKTKRTGASISHVVGRALLVLLVCATVLGALASCGAQPAVKAVNTAATATAGAQATQAAEPVVVTADVRQEGTVADKNVTLVVDVTVQNQSSAPIYLARFNCSPPIIHVGLYDAFLVWHNWGNAPCLKNPGCPPNDGGGIADQMMAPGATYPWSMRNDLYANIPPPPTLALQAGKSYTVQIMVYWLSRACAPQATPPPPLPLHTITITKAITFS